MTNQEHKTPLVAQQAITATLDGKRVFNFHCIMDVGKYESVKIVKSDGDGYPSIRAVINSLPLEHRPVEQLKREVMIDYGLGFGTDYPELGVVAFVGTFITVKPIVWYIKDGKEVYVPHPQIRLMLKRYM